MPNFKPPLSYEELHAIGERNRTNADAKALLWEIKRLHSIVLRADQLQRSLPASSSSGIDAIVDSLRRQLKDEPCVVKDAKLRHEMLHPK